MKSLKILESRAYTPYSGSPQYAVVKGKSGNYYPGVRVENVSYPLSITAVQAALYGCMSESDIPVEIILPEGDSEFLIDYWKSHFSLKISHTFPEESELTNYILQPGNELRKDLEKLLERASVSESNFPVACILETEKGWVTGVNIEVGSWPLGLCAERVAISKAVASGAGQILAAHVTAPKSDYVSPCGACRQVLFEHLMSKRVYLYQNDGGYFDVTAEQLLPYHFKGDVLKKF